MAPRFVARQLARPAGIGGWFVRKMMNRGNASMNDFALKELDVQPSDKVLEIGFGGGLTLHRLMAAAGSLSGLDRSADAVAAASAKFATEITANRASFAEGSIEKMPFAAASFDKVLTVNTIYFWNSLAEGFSEIARVLAPGGRLVLGFLPKERMDRMEMPTDIFTTRAPDEVVDAARAAGLGAVDLRRPQPSTLWTVLVATSSRPGR